jgi:putative addiction module killer protein
LIEIRETAVYANWFESLSDEGSRAKVLVRVRRLSLGNPGDVRPVGQGVSEMRIHCGPGLRAYFTARGAHQVIRLVILLGGGDKSTQARDIRRAIELSKQIEG